MQRIVLNGLPDEDASKLEGVVWDLDNFRLQALPCPPEIGYTPGLQSSWVDRSNLLRIHWNPPVPGGLAHLSRGRMHFPWDYTQITPLALALGLVPTGSDGAL